MKAIPCDLEHKDAHLEISVQYKEVVCFNRVTLLHWACYLTFRQIKDKTLGVIGYGDIGQAAARKAKAMGMKIIGQRRRPELSEGDGIADELMGDGQAR